MVPDGLIANLSGPYEGKRYDSTMLHQSGLLPLLEQHGAYNRSLWRSCIPTWCPSTRVIQKPPTYLRNRAIRAYMDKCWTSVIQNCLLYVNSNSAMVSINYIFGCFFDKFHLSVQLVAAAVSSTPSYDSA